jgi:hypothetical protein
MKKTKLSTKTIVRYIRDFSIVVAGIAVTLYVNYKVTNKGEKRDMNLYLNAIKIELEENIKELDKAVAFSQREVRYAEYIGSHNKESVEKDTVNSYVDVFFSVQIYTFKMNAFDMFKYSGTMRLMDNKELLLSIWDIYDNLSAVYESMEWVGKAKWEDLRKELSVLIENDMKITGIPMYNYYHSGFAQNTLKNCEELRQKLKELAEKLELSIHNPLLKTNGNTNDTICKN